MLWPVKERRKFAHPLFFRDLVLSSKHLYGIHFMHCSKRLDIENLLFVWFSLWFCALLEPQHWESSFIGAQRLYLFGMVYFAISLTWTLADKPSFHLDSSIRYWGFILFKTSIYSLISSSATNQQEVSWTLHKRALEEKQTAVLSTTI